MSFSSGTFSINSAGQPVVTGTVISSTAFNALTADLATGLSTCILKDGTQTLTANIPFGNFKLTGLGAGTARTDAASLANVQDGTGVYVGTVGGTADVITLTPSPAITAYAAGQTFRWIASGANTTNVTVNVSALGAKAITKNGTTALVAGDIPSGTMVEATYDGTRFILEGGSLGMPASLIDAAGDLIVGTAADTAGRLAIGTALQRLRTNAGATALEWATQSASDTVAGDIEIATQAEQETGTSTTLAVTPGRQHFHPSAAKVWIRFNGSGTIAIDASYNVNSITDGGTGLYTVTIETDFSTANYAVTATAFDDATTGNTADVRTIAAGSYIVGTYNSSGTPVDCEIVSSTAFGDQA